MGKGGTRKDETIVHDIHETETLLKRKDENSVLLLKVC